MIPGYLAGAARDRPAIAGYQWRARTYPGAVRAIQRAQAQYGEPQPTCVCGGPITWGGNHGGPPPSCDVCGRSPLESLRTLEAT